MDNVTPLNEANLDRAVDYGLSQGSRAWRPDPDTSLIRSATPPAPHLPLSAFFAAADYLKRAGLGANVKPDYVAAMLVSAVGGIIGKAYQVRVSADWFEPLAAWVALIGNPSSGKTPACKAIKRKLKSLEIEIGETHRRLIEGDILEAEQRDAPADEINALKEKLDRPPRLIVNDSTSEALARVEARSLRGLLVERDELAGLLEALERYSAGVDRAYYLEGYNGGPYTMDRVKAGTIAILDHLLSICGGIQPERLRALLTHSGADDGFASRLTFWWPDPLPAKGIPSGADHTIMERALDRIQSLPSGENGQKVTMRLSPEGFDALNNWYEFTHGARKGQQGKIGSALGKFPGYAGRFAGLLHVIDWAFGPEGVELPHTIHEKHVLGALKLIEDYLIPQLYRAYAGTDCSPADALAGDILRECKKRGARKLNMRNVRREWHISGAHRQGASKLFKEASDALVEGGWLVAERKQGGSSDFAVNPALFVEA